MYEKETCLDIFEVFVVMFVFVLSSVTPEKVRKHYLKVIFIHVLYPFFFFFVWLHQEHLDIEKLLDICVFRGTSLTWCLPLGKTLEQTPAPFVKCLPIAYMLWLLSCNITSLGFKGEGTLETQNVSALALKFMSSELVVGVGHEKQSLVNAIKDLHSQP